MKNEAMIRAITDLDDDLILSAASRSASASARTFSPRLWSRLCAVAACLLFITAFTVLFRLPESVDIQVNGQALRNTAIVLQTEQGVSPVSSRVLQDVVLVPLQIQTADSVILRVDAGYAEMTDGDSSIPLASGSAFAVSGTVSVNWILRQPDIREVYQMEIGDRTLFLTFDADLNCWTISKK